ESTHNGVTWKLSTISSTCESSRIMNAPWWQLEVVTPSFSIYYSPISQTKIPTLPLMKRHQCYLQLAEVISRPYKPSLTYLNSTRAAKLVTARHTGRSQKNVVDLGGKPKEIY